MMHDYITKFYKLEMLIYDNYIFLFIQDYYLRQRGNNLILNQTSFPKSNTNFYSAGKIYLNLCEAYWH